MSVFAIQYMLAKYMYSEFSTTPTLFTAQYFGNTLLKMLKCDEYEDIYYEVQHSTLQNRLELNTYEHIEGNSFFAT